MKAVEKEKANPHYTKGFREEIPDPTPIELPIGYEHPESLESMIARMVRIHSEQAAKNELETFEEADDLDMSDDDDGLASEHELTPMQEENLYVRGRDYAGGKKEDIKDIINKENGEQSGAKEQVKKSAKKVVRSKVVEEDEVEEEKQ
jgi:hypothetical protein